MKTSAEVVALITKWYNELAFPLKYDDEFYGALETIYVDKNAKSSEYDIREEDGKKNFLHYLYFCEELKARYEQKGIPLKYLYDKLQDLPRWTVTWSDIKGELYLGELDWVQCLFRMSLLKVGRLQYNMTKAIMNVREKGIQKGDNILAIHIPADGPLMVDDCIESIKTAGAFFRKYYPEFDYTYMDCSSWLLSDGLKDMLKSDSNILKFQGLFDVIDKCETDAIIKYVIGWRIDREAVKEMQFDSRLKNEVKTRVLAGEKFYAGYGVVKDKYM